MKTLCIIHPELNFLAFDPHSKLLTSEDRTVTNTCHTSLGDLSASVICDLAANFDIIKFVPHLFDTRSALYNETMILLNFLSHSHVIENFTIKPVIPLLDIDVHTRDNQPTIWVFGCSMSHGVGLDLPEQRYGHILSTVYNLPVRFVTMNGSSIFWSLRHLVNANILPGDIVIWQITTPHRMTLVSNGTPVERLLKDVEDKFVVASLNEDQILYNHLSVVNQGVQYLRALGVNFAMISILNNVPRYYDYVRGYTSYKEYCYIPNQELDVGNDNLHSGPLTHKHVAAQLERHLKMVDH